MKKIIVIILIGISQYAKAQVNISLSQNSRPMANLNAWSTRADMLTLVATYPQGQNLQCKINTTLSDVSGNVIASTKLSTAQPKLIKNGTNLFYAKDVLDLTALEFNKGIQQKIVRSGQLPSGTYQLTVVLVRVDQPEEISNEQSKIFTISPTLLPVLIKPSFEEVIDRIIAQSAITFRWSPLIPNKEVSYRICVFEVLENQTRTQAVRATMPLLDKLVTGTTQFIWNPQLLFSDTGLKQMVWTIQCLDKDNQPIVSENQGSQGISEPNPFYIGNPKN